MKDEEYMFHYHLKGGFSMIVLVIALHFRLLFDIS
jgi:hypothetical protein